MPQMLALNCKEPSNFKKKKKAATVMKKLLTIKYFLKYWSQS